MAPSRRRLLLGIWFLWTVWQALQLSIAGVTRAGSDRPTLAEPARIDINRARVAELALLPGIGPGRAEAIVLHRVRHGRFRAAADLLAVDGLGETTVRGLVDFIAVGPR